MRNEHDSADAQVALEALDSLFFRALELPECDRAAFLDRACGGNHALRRSVERMLRADRLESGLIDAAPWSELRFEARLAASEERSTADLIGKRVGAYELIEQIGAGGMGTVWRARRVDAQFEREVAVKFIKRGMDSDEIVRRFRRERELLARLEHPNIARLYDAGVNDEGYPYLVLEYISGEPIHQYCQRRKLEVDDILALFGAVCSAVNFAHSHLVLHRDIKPGNVLVTAAGDVKLLDFGIAKLLGDQEAAATQTRGNQILTPRYASPEQIRGQRLATSSDVYSLGVLLYELITGQSPYGPSSSSRAEIELAALERIPLAASEAVTRSEHPPDTRRTRARRLRGDVDGVVARALEKRPEDRYASAEQFGEDVRRLREGLPLLARGPGPLRRMKQVWRRHRRAALVLTVALSSIFAAASLGLSYSLLAPEWAQEHLRSARSTLLTPEFANRIWILSFNNQSGMHSPDRQPDCPRELAESALLLYDAALRFDAELGHAQAERLAVWLAAEITERFGEAPRIPARLEREAPLACEYARRWSLEGAIPDVLEALDRADDEDLRSLGFVAMLCGDTRTCLRAWGGITDSHPDPVREALLGILYLVQDAPQRAYPRLLSAHRAFPELGFLATYLADAALGCGDVDYAGALLAQTDSLPNKDPQRGRQRVWLKYYLATGQEGRAEEVFVEQHAEANFVTRVQYARYLFDAGREEAALDILVRLCGSPEHIRDITAPMMRSFFELMQRWWVGRSAQEREYLIAAAAYESCNDPGSLFRRLHAYLASLRRTRRYHQEHSLPGGPGALANDPLVSTDAHHELLELHERLEIDNAFRWARLARFPDHLRDALVRAWLASPDPAAAARQVDAAFADWERETGAKANAGAQKLLPEQEDGGLFGYRVQLDRDLAVVITASRAIPYRYLAGAWRREAIDLPADVRVQEAVVADGRILALFVEPGDDALSVPRLALFEFDPIAQTWSVAGFLPLPDDCSTGARVCLDAGLAIWVETRGGPIYAFSEGEQCGAWQASQVAPHEAGVIWRAPSLRGGTLALFDQESGSCVHIFRRGVDERWRLEAKLGPPAGAKWRSVSSGGDRIAATATNNANHPVSVQLLERDARGNWAPAADSESLRQVLDEGTGQRVVLAGDMLALTAGDEGFHTLRVDLFQLMDRGWRRVDTFRPGDLGFGDEAGDPALSAPWLMFGAPRHDEGGIDAGAAYLFRLPQPAGS